MFTNMFVVIAVDGHSQRPLTYGKGSPSRNRNALNIYALPTSFVGLAVADLVQPWVTWTPE